MMIGDLYLIRAIARPSEADSVLAVDTNTVLAGSVSPKSLQTVPRRNRQVTQFNGGVNLVKLAECCLQRRLGTDAPGGGGVVAVENIFSASVNETPDHFNMLARLTCYIQMSTE